MSEELTAWAADMWQHVICPELEKVGVGDLAFPLDTLLGDTRANVITALANVAVERHRAYRRAKRAEAAA